jgi:phage FluMu protein gp41
MREEFSMLEQISGNFSRPEIAKLSKQPWHKSKQNQQLIETIKANKVSKKIDKSMKVTSGTCTFNYQTYFSVKTG